MPLDGRTPGIADFPIWMAEGERVSSLALPNEPPSSVADLAKHFNAQLLVLASPDRGIWPATLASGDPAAACFHEVALAVPADPFDAAALKDVRVWQIACP